MELFDKVKKWKDDDPRAKAIGKLIVKMFATDSLPFTVVQNIGFQQLVSNLSLGMKLNLKHFSEGNCFLPLTMPKKIKEILSKDYADDLLVSPPTAGQAAQNQ